MERAIFSERSESNSFILIIYLEVAKDQSKVDPINNLISKFMYISQ